MYANANGNFLFWGENSHLHFVFIFEVKVENLEEFGFVYNGRKWPGKMVAREKSITRALSIGTKAHKMVLFLGL